MVGFRTASGVVFAALLLASAAGCGGTVEHGGPSGESGSSQGGFAGRAGAASGGSNLGRAGGGAANAGTSQAGGTVVDPNPVETSCPEADLPPPELQCDPFEPTSCAPGLGCYPFVEHPEGSGCDQQRYGTVCLPSGLGTQGDSCGPEAGDCAAGFVCVVGQRAGKRCAALCQLGKAGQCRGGLVCGDLDVAGFGVCG
jgi:hypothetical protein